MTQRHKIPCFSSKMKSSSKKHTQSLIVTLSLLLLFSPVIPTVGAQSGPNESGSRSGNQEYYARFSPSMAIIIAVLVTALFFMGFFSIYIRRCADTTGGSVRPIISMRRRAAASRGLDAEVIQTFPTFAYDVVKDLNIGKGALECAVCLNEFEENETLRLIPKCDHVFHPECIDAWLASHVTCPVCRANLVPQPGEATQESDESNHESDHELDNNQQNGDVSIRISDENNYPQVPPINRNFSSKSRSIVPGFFERFRSHSTGHSLVQPGENVDRFTLRLPADVRKQVIKRALLNRTASDVVVLPREGSSRRGFRTGEGSNRGRSYRRLESLDRVVRSERWAKLPSFLSRALSIKSPKVKGESSTAATADHALLHSGRLKSDDARPVSANSTVPPV